MQPSTQTPSSTAKGKKKAKPTDSKADAAATLTSKGKEKNKSLKAAAKGEAKDTDTTSMDLDDLLGDSDDDEIIKPKDTRGDLVQKEASPSSAAVDQPDDADAEEDDSFPLISGSNAKRMRTKATKSKEHLKALMQALSENPDEMHRYEAYRRSRINPSTIRKIMQNLLGQTGINPNTAIIVGGVVKVLVGELTEEALEVMKERGQDEPPIMPSHLREAYNRLKRRGVLYPTASGFKSRRGFP